MLKLHCVRTPMGLQPCSDDDHDRMRSLRQGEVYEVAVKMQRNYKFHCKYFALITLAWEYLPERICSYYVNMTNFRHDVEMCAGCVERVYSYRLGEFVEQHRSISFDKMDEAEFGQFYERVKDVLFATFLKHVDESEFFTKLIDF